MRTTMYIGWVILTATVAYSGCFHSRSSSSNDDRYNGANEQGTSTTGSDSHAEERNTSSSDDTDEGTDSEVETCSGSESDTDVNARDTESSSGSDIGTDTGRSDPDTGDEACAAMNASPNGTKCGEFIGVYWDGELCRDIYCGCSGEDCDKLYVSQGACVTERAACMEVCPHVEYPDVLTQDDDGCLCGKQQYQHCCPDGMDFCSCEEGWHSDELFLVCGETDSIDF